MSLFKIDKETLNSVKEMQFDLERDLQRLVEKNLDQIFNLQFVSSEFQLHGLRIDSLAFDEENKSFVIIEYKRDRSQSVIDQGFSYLALMVNNKAEFILQYNDSLKHHLSRTDVDWEQSKVLFISNHFTTYQRKAIEFKDLPIELWEVSKYENGLILFNEIKPAEAKESIKTISKDKTIQNVSREVKKYSVEDHFKENWRESREIFDALSEKVMNIDARIEMNPKRSYIGFRIGSRNVVSLHIYESKVMIVFPRTEPKDLKDPEKKVAYWKNSLKHYNQHLSTYNVTSLKDVDYAIFLAKQGYEKYFK